MTRAISFGCTTRISEPNRCERWRQRITWHVQPSGRLKSFAAFHRKLREGAIRKAAYSALVAQVNTHIEAGAFQWLGQDEQTLLRVREVYEHLPSSVYLRGADAIHLATAAQAGLQVVYSNSSHLLAAASHFGIEGKNVIGRG